MGGRVARDEDFSRRRARVRLPVYFIVAFFALLGAPQLHAQTAASKADPVLGKDYAVAVNPQATITGDKIEVLQFFFYPCSHCYKLFPFLVEWEKKKPKDVELVNMPTIFSDIMSPMALTYYALESLGENMRLHDVLYKAWHEKNLELETEKLLTDYVVEQGVNRAKFARAYNSADTQAKAEHSRQLAVDYVIRGTPTVIVDGRYMVYGLSPQDTMRVLDFLIDKVRMERAGK